VQRVGKMPLLALTSRGPHFLLASLQPCRLPVHRPI